MKRLSLVILAFLLSLSTAAMAVVAPHADDAAADQTAPSYDMKAQSLVDLEQVNKKFVALANALPANKFKWRPSADSRSFAEVFLHVAGERYGILNMMGTKMPDGFDGKTFDKSTTDKARVVEELNKSWEFAKAAITGMSNADFAKLLPKLGPQANAEDVIYILVADAHEHLGQTIAYARVNGIVPPWTIEQQKKAMEAKEKEKDKK